MFLLLTRTTHVELEATSFNERQDIIEQETVKQKTGRILVLVFEALLIAGMLISLPVVINFVIIPHFGPGNTSSLSIGIYCLVILLFQVLGTTRSFMSFFKKKIRKENQENPPPSTERSSGAKKPLWKDPLRILRAGWFAAAIVLLSLCLEFLQLSLFPFVSEEIVESLVNSTELRTPVEAILTARDVVYLNVTLFDAIFWISEGLVLLLLSLFCIQFMHELHLFALMKRLSQTGSATQKKVAREYFFFSFVGSVVYSHGEPRQMSRRLTAIIGSFPLPNFHS